MTESVKQRVAALSIHGDQRALIALLTSLQQDIANLQASFNAHVHAANDTVPTVLAGDLNTTE